jgi:hypothetical protein
MASATNYCLAVVYYACCTLPASCGHIGRAAGRAVTRLWRLCHGGRNVLYTRADGGDGDGDGDDDAATTSSMTEAEVGEVNIDDG